MVAPSAPADDAVAEHAAARDLAAVPEIFMVASVVSHDEFLPVRSDKRRGRRPERIGEGQVRRRHLGPVAELLS
jgi:hypothetical protein